MAHHTKNLLSTTVPAINKQRVIREAETQQKIIDDKIKRLGLNDTDYELRELIGKGAFGRVYKSTKKSTKAIVAVKILETDRMDFQARATDMESGITEAMKEIGILRRLKESGAVNVNMFIEAFQFHSQLWIINEYCSGGSLSTLRRATENKLPERLLIPIARELAIGLRSIHAAGIVHRDIKSANVMINEAGRLQIIDFGVSGIILSNLDEHKRKTVIGTPHWMPPEMHQNATEVAHGMEVDVWAYGITIYECAMGAPPHHRTAPQSRELRSKIRQLTAPRLPEDRFSSDLADFVGFALESDPIKRPSMDVLCKNGFLEGTEESHPTETLRELVEKYYIWEIGGGQRASLFMPHGAAAPEALKYDEEDDESEQWSFSTTAEFDEIKAPALARQSMMANPMSDFGDMLAGSPPPEEDDFGFYDQPTSRYSGAGETASKKGKPADHERRVERGAHALQGIFDEKASPYKKASDLPLRSDQSGSSLHRKEVSVSSSNGGQPSINLKLGDIPKKNRPETMKWQFDANLAEVTIPTVPYSDFGAPMDDAGPFLRPQFKHSATEPLTGRPASTLDLDALMDPGPNARNTLNLDDLMAQDETYSNNGDHLTEMRTSRNMNNHMNDDVSRPMTLDLDGLMGDDLLERKSKMYAQPPWLQNTDSSFPSFTDDEQDIGHTLRPGHGAQLSIASSSLDPTDLDNNVGDRSFDSLIPPHTQQYPDRTSQRSSHRSSQNAAHLPQPVPAAALVDGAPMEIIMDALETQVKNWTLTLQACDAMLVNLEAGGSDDDDDEVSHYASSSRNGSGNWNFGEPIATRSDHGDDEEYHGEGETTGDDADEGADKSGSG